MSHPVHNFSNQRVTVMGLGRHGGGVAAVRYLVSCGARVIVADLQSESSLAESLEQINDLPLEGVHCGEHREADFCEADFVVVNPAVRRDAPMLHLARESGAKLTSEIELFLEACPAQMIGVTGSNGKSTTAAMLAAMLQADAHRCHLGGNIGRSLLPELPLMSDSDWVVLELSSFQLAHMSSPERLPSMAVVTNCAPNHLDWHISYADYRRAKQRLILDQPEQGWPEQGWPEQGWPEQGWTVLGSDTEVASWRTLCPGNVKQLVSTESIPPLPVPGKHNINNARCAATAALAAGCRESSIRTALESFDGLPHRLQLVTEHQGRRFYEDSSATTPESVMAALAAIDQPVWLLAGGKAKGSDFTELGQCVARIARGACFYGESRGQLYEAVPIGSCQANLQKTETLREALFWCSQQSQPGESIVLSPGCASYDQFHDYAHRAMQFREWIDELTAHETKVVSP